jgi:hypothetical protein
MRALLRAAAGFAAVVLVVRPAGAQVGHDPARSPYRDLQYGQFLSVSGGYLFGDGGKLGIGPHHGPVVVVRHDFLADRPFMISLGGGWARAERNYADTNAIVNRVKGPIEHNLYWGEFITQLNLVGGRTWHDVAPYVNLGLGLAGARQIKEDTSGYKFGVRFFAAPGAGVRIFFSRRLYLRLEARAMFWNLSYPSVYGTHDPDGFGPLLPLLAGQSLKEWSPVPLLHAGLGYAFHRPFF